MSHFNINITDTWCAYPHYECGFGSDNLNSFTYLRDTNADPFWTTRIRLHPCIEAVWLCRSEIFLSPLLLSTSLNLASSLSLSSPVEIKKWRRIRVRVGVSLSAEGPTAASPWLPLAAVLLSPRWLLSLLRSAAGGGARLQILSLLRRDSISFSLLLLLEEEELTSSR